MDIVIGTRSEQNGNDVNIGRGPKDVNSTAGSEYVFGSVTDQKDGKYVILGRVQKTQILMPEFSDPNGVPRYFVEAIDGPSGHVDVMSPERRRVVQKKLKFLTDLCQELKGRMYQLLSGGKNSRATINVLYDIISAETKLQVQENHFRDFNAVMPLSRSKPDNFDGDLKIIELEIEQLVVRSLAVTQSQN